MRSLKRILLLTVLAVLTCGQVKAQLDKVEPGVKGKLPAPPELPKAAEGTFGALSVRKVHLDGMFSNYWISVELQFPEASSFGGDSYTIQYHEDGSDSWKDLEDGMLYLTSTELKTFTYVGIDIDR